MLNNIEEFVNMDLNWNLGFVGRIVYVGRDNVILLNCEGFRSNNLVNCVVIEIMSRMWFLEF